MRQLMFRSLWLALMLPAALHAQTDFPELRFDQLEHDFGTLREEAGEASHTYVFRNTGKSPVTLVDVKPSCGCTTPDWTREPVGPGKTGVIKATYSTVGRPGPFQKTVTVRAQVAGQPEERIVVLSFRGNVLPRPKGIADFYPHKSGSLRMSTNNLSFNRVLTGKVSNGTLKLYNEGDRAVSLQRAEMPAYLQVNGLPATLQPKDSLILPLALDGARVNDLGFLSDRILLHTDDTQDPVKLVYLVAMVEEDFSGLTAEERANAPTATFDSTTYHFGSVTPGTVVTHEFKLRNTGKRELVIRKTKPSCGCTASEPSKSVLKPGEETSIRVSFDSTGRTDRQVKYVTVFTNDPKNPMVNLALDGTVRAAAPGASR